MIDEWRQFVIKPTRGSGGKGILVIVGREGEFFIKSSGQQIELKDIRRHTNNILSGLYSLGGKPDSAMLESLIDYDSVFTDYTYEGVPDIRVIVFQGFPVMAMLRCATHASDGRANLHQGAIGVGLDLMTGRALNAVHRGNPVAQHPDTGKSFSELQIPQWQTILLLSAGCFEMTKLGYIGCDIVLDKQAGPIILELNARPGLAIQVANGVGLKRRLENVEKLLPEELELPPEQRVGLLHRLI
jgi:alpha-L-glutamate ligase-like protein